MFKSQSNIGEDYKETFTYRVILTEIQSYYFKTKFIHTYIEEAVDNGVCAYMFTLRIPFVSPYEFRAATTFLKAYQARTCAGGCIRLHSQR